MGQGGSSQFTETFQSTVSELSQVQLAQIGARFNELYQQSGGRRGRLIDREAFSRYFNIPVQLGDRLFNAFDKKKNGVVDFEEFVCGLAVVLHGSFTDKCRLLFELFNIAGDEGISREELATMLAAIVSSTSTILLTVAEGGYDWEGQLMSDSNQAVKSVVDAAFSNCDITQTGKLLPLEFEYWLKRNPDMLDLLLPSPSPLTKPTLAPLLLVSKEEEEQEKESIEIVINEPEEKEETEQVDENKQEDAVMDEVVISIDGDESEGDESTQPGQEEPPSSPNDEWDGHRVLGGVAEEDTSSKEQLEDSEEVERIMEDDKSEDRAATEEGREVEEGKEAEEVKEIVEGKEAEKVKQVKELEEGKEAEESSLDAATIQLARQLSQELTDSLSPKSLEEDRFTAFAKDNIVPEEDREVDDCVLSAWLPSQWVTTVLASGRKVPPEQLTRPGIIAITEKCDPVGELLASTFPESERRQQLTADQVKMDEDGLRKLISGGYYHAALTLTSNFLSAHGQGLSQVGQMTLHTHRTLQMWCVRLSILSLLGRHTEALEEFKAFGELDQPDLYYQYNKHNYPTTIGSMVPFSMRLLHAVLPMKCGNHQLTLNRLCLLQHKCQKILDTINSGSIPISDKQLNPQQKTVAVDVWTRRLARVKCGLADCLLSLGDYSLVREVMESVRKLLPDSEAEICSSLGRLTLQCGDVRTAQQYFQTVENLAKNDSSKLPLVHNNSGFINIYYSQWGKAESNFKAAVGLDSGSLVATNNAAVCSVYQGHLMESIGTLEDGIKSSPPSSLQSALFTNLFSCYHLESSHHQARTLSWLPLLGLHAPEGFNIAPLRHSIV